MNNFKTYPEFFYSVFFYTGKFRDSIICDLHFTQVYLQGCHFAMPVVAQIIVTFYHATGP